MALPEMTNLTVCVFCASSDSVGPDLRTLAGDLGRTLAQRSIRVVYGGGGIGLMGELARAAMAAGGEVVGIIPERLTQRERAAPELTELHVVATLRERKEMMDRLSDGFCVLPGGIGTLEELMEIVTLRQLGYHERPVVLLDPDGFWDPLRAQLEVMVAARMADPGVLGLAATVASVEEAVDLLVERIAVSTRGGTALGG